MFFFSLPPTNSEHQALFSGAVVQRLNYLVMSNIGIFLKSLSSLYSFIHLLTHSLIDLISLIEYAVVG